MGYWWYNDQISFPILATASSYTSDTTFTITVDYFFASDHPYKDYTLRVYSKLNLDVKDSEGNTNMLHMDGQEPSGFRYTTAAYLGKEEINTVTPKQVNVWESEGVVPVEDPMDAVTTK